MYQLQKYLVLRTWVGSFNAIVLYTDSSLVLERYHHTALAVLPSDTLPQPRCICAERFLAYTNWTKHRHGNSPSQALHLYPADILRTAHSWSKVPITEILNSHTQTRHHTHTPATPFFLVSCCDALEKTKLGEVHVQRIGYLAFFFFL